MRLYIYISFYPEVYIIRCPELEPDDCPEGTILTDKVMLGCCPACLR